MTNKVFTFGKHNGQPISTVPTTYLRWVKENVLDHPEIQQAITQELEIRQDWDEYEGQRSGSKHKHINKDTRKFL